jgi:hypothetical protein
VRAPVKLKRCSGRGLRREARRESVYKNRFPTGRAHLSFSESNILALYMFDISAEPLRQPKGLSGPKFIDTTACERDDVRVADLVRTGVKH